MHHLAFPLLTVLIVASGPAEAQTSSATSGTSTSVDPAPAISGTSKYSPPAACLPAPISPMQAASNPAANYASTATISYNAVGTCIMWKCYFPQENKVTKMQYCGTWAIQHLVGSRIQTIAKSADPLKSLSTAGTRFTIVPLDDPSMAGMPLQ